ncbi:MAG: class B sortase, partial [Muribaculaceae bacterium]|nr:class B sortase [Muribaculaceae bacterium]
MVTIMGIRMKTAYIASMIICLGIFLFSVTMISFYQRDIEVNERENEEVIRYVMQDDGKAEQKSNGKARQKTDGKAEEEGNGKPGQAAGAGTDRVQIDFGKLQEFNPDAVGWILFNHQCVNYPLVQTGDNAYYLDHSFRREENTAGCIFMDCRNQSFADQNVVIYGHSMLNRTMFGSLKDVFGEDFWEEADRDVILIAGTDHYLRKYEIFSYYVIEEEDYYITTSFPDEDNYAEFLDVIQARSFR